MTDVYIIGGSPCAGKSTVAEYISKKYGMYYFKVDDFLNEYTEKGAKSGKPICLKQKKMTPEQVWMREPEEQNTEELQYYDEISEFVMEDICNISNHSTIITEGAAFTPDIVKRYDIANDRYLNITPTPEFQVSHFKERPWISIVLTGCQDKEAAFKNWMNRDILFAESVREGCRENGYQTMVNDGSMDITAFADCVCRKFGL